jgi:nodulation protein E
VSDRRIVITGLGGLCSVGTDAGAIWQSMCAGRSGIGPLTIDRRDLKTNVGGEIGAIDDSAIDPRRRATMGNFSVLAVLAASEALAAAGVDTGAMDPARIGATIGVAVWGSDAVDEAYRDVFLEGKKRAHILAVPRAMPSAAAGQVSMHLGLRGPVFGVTSACSSSNHAICAAADQLRLGRADIMLAGGADTPLVYGILKVWESLRVLARESCRPFSADRDGLVMADGAGVAVLETWEHATARGAPILAELVGCGMSADASDIVTPTVEGPAAAMQACLDDAGLAADAVDYINAHGTGTKANDRTETQAIRAVFGEHADRLSVSSTKSMHGHCLGASGAIELIACVNAIRHGVVPPTIGYTEPDPECDLDITANVARERPVNVVMSNAFAFGGMNAVIAVRKV